MFNENQDKILSQELEQNRIRTRDKAGVKLAYLEGFDVIETANYIFGFGGWNYEIISLKKVSQEINNNQNAVICYKAIVKVEVFNSDHTKSIIRQDVGFGTGVARNLADANENAAKEAVTDGLKRSLRTFGNQFGNSLYDKSRANSNAQPKRELNLVNSQIQTRQTNQNNQPKDETMVLQNLGLQVAKQNGFLLLSGKDVFANKDTIKSFGFRWDANSKQWYKAINQDVA